MYKFLSVFALTVLLLSCSAYSKNEEAIQMFTSAAEDKKGEFTYVKITGHKEFKNYIEVYVSMKDSLEVQKFDTLKFALTGDGLVSGILNN